MPHCLARDSMTDGLGLCPCSKGSRYRAHLSDLTFFHNLPPIVFLSFGDRGSFEVVHRAIVISLRAILHIQGEVFFRSSVCQRPHFLQYFPFILSNSSIYQKLAPPLSIASLSASLIAITPAALLNLAGSSSRSKNCPSLAATLPKLLPLRPLRS